MPIVMVSWPARSANAGRQTAPRRLIPSYWVEGVARLNADRPPNDVPRHRWRQFVEDCNAFLSSSENWPERAHQLRWDAMTLFGCAPRRPLDYSGNAGLLWALNGGRLVELHRDPTKSVIYAALGLPPRGDPLDFPDTPSLRGVPRIEGGGPH